MLPCQKGLDFIEANLNEYGSFISVISMIELLGWQAPGDAAMRQVEKFVQDSTVVPLTDAIAWNAIEIRRFRKVRLADAVIAATALQLDYTLVSRNDDDFRKISGLKYLNLFTDI